MSGCSTGCSVCSGPASNQCTSCVSGYRLYVNTCVTACPSATYATSTACLSKDFEPQL